MNIQQLLCWETSFNGQLVRCSIHRHYLTTIACLEQRNKTVVMVDGERLVTTLPLAYVSYCMPNYSGSYGLFRLGNEHTFSNEEHKL